MRKSIHIRPKIIEIALYQINLNRRGRVPLPARVFSIKNNTDLVNLVLELYRIKANSIPIPTVSSLLQMKSSDRQYGILDFYPPNAHQSGVQRVEIGCHN